MCSATFAPPKCAPGGARVAPLRKRDAPTPRYGAAACNLPSRSGAPSLFLDLIANVDGRAAFARTPNPPRATAGFRRNVSAGDGERGRSSDWAI